MRLVEKLDDFRFRLTFPELPQEKPLNIDFQPFIDFYNLKSNFVLLHWQARPKTIRGYACYDGATKNYYCTDWNKLQIINTPIEALQLNESVVKTVPTAVLLFRNRRLVFNGRFYEIVQ